MQKEINFLRAEVIRKDEIIKIITEERKELEATQEQTSKRKNNKSKNNKNNKPMERTPIAYGKKTITILGDSITKEVKSQKLRKKLNKIDKIFIKIFPGATTSQMVHYAKPSLEYDPNIIILHCRTNDLRAEKEPDEIANDIVRLGKSMMNEGNDVMISSLIKRSDRYGKKADLVNKKLKNKGNQNSIDYIDNSNLRDSHLSRDGLHLNFKGTLALGDNFVNAITA